MNVSENLYIAKGGGRGGGGGRSSGGSKSSGSSKSNNSSKSSGGSKSTPKSSTPKSGTSKAKPGAKVKDASGKEITSSTKTPTNKKYTNSKGVVGDNGYTPRYQNGYNAPAGSVIYRDNNSVMDYLPWIYLFSLGGDSPRNDKEVIVQPDGKEVEAKPVRDGVDGLAIVNWIFLILIVCAIIGGVVYGVNKFAGRKK